MYFFDKELLGIWILLTGSLEEFTPPNTTVSFSNLVNLNCVITAEELNNKSSIVFFLHFTNLSGLKSHYVLILSEILSHILLRRFRLQRIYGTFILLLRIYLKSPLPIHIRCKEGFVGRIQSTSLVEVLLFIIRFLSYVHTILE